jgi:hypothetical protein
MMVIKLQLILMVSKQLVPSVGGKEEYVAESVDPLSEENILVPLIVFINMRNESLFGLVPSVLVIVGSVPGEG